MLLLRFLFDNYRTVAAGALFFCSIKCVCCTKMCLYVSEMHLLLSPPYRRRCCFFSFDEMRFCSPDPFCLQKCVFVWRTCCFGWPLAELNMPKTKLVSAMTRWLWNRTCKICFESDIYSRKQQPRGWICICRHANNAYICSYVHMHVCVYIWLCMVM